LPNPYKNVLDQKGDTAFFARIVKPRIDTRCSRTCLWISEILYFTSKPQNNQNKVALM